MKLDFDLIDLNGDIYFNEKIQNYPIVIISHGFKGWKDWGFIPYLAQKISQKNAIAITFNYSHNGKPDDTGYLTDIENFANNSINREIQDLENIINSLQNNTLNIPNEIFDKWNGDIFLIGHSLGAGISLIVGSKIETVKKIILLASVGLFDRYTPRQKKLWENQGYIEFPNQTTNQILRLNINFLKDLEKNKSKYDLKAIAQNITKPILFIHGEQDYTVPLKEITPLIKTNNKYVSSVLIPKTGHTFGIVHPFEKPSKELQQVLENILQFLDIS